MRLGPVLAGPVHSCVGAAGHFAAVCCRVKGGGGVRGILPSSTADQLVKADASASTIGIERLERVYVYVVILDHYERLRAAAISSSNADQLVAADASASTIGRLESAYVRILDHYKRLRCSHLIRGRARCVAPRASADVASAA